MQVWLVLPTVESSEFAARADLLRDLQTLGEGVAWCVCAGGSRGDFQRFLLRGVKERVKSSFCK